MSYSRRVVAFISFAWRAGSRAISVGGDLVYATSTPLTIALPAVRAAHRLRVPMVFEVRDLWPRVPIELGVLRNTFLKWVALKLERYAYRNAEHIVTVAPGMKSWIVALGYPESSVSVIPHGCDAGLLKESEQRGNALRESLTWLGDRPLAVYVGALGLVNGTDYLVRLAAETLPIDGEVRFAIVGDGREMRLVSELASALGVLDVNLFIVGAIPKADVPSWLGAATVTLSLIRDETCLWENVLTNKFFDSLGAGRPIVSNHPGDQTDVAVGAGAGAELDAHDIPAAASRLVQLVRDDVWLVGARSAATCLATERFDRDNLATELEDLLKRAIETYRSGRRRANP
jgi:glycosyltransferase involved in cell wall biosynthesis